MTSMHLWRLIDRLGGLFAERRGATAIEYALIAASIAGIIVAVVTSIGQETGYGFGELNNNYQEVKPDIFQGNN